jgi:hypothetical protein
MSINFTSVTVTNGSANVVINTSIDLTAIQYGWELQVVGAPLMLSIASGGQSIITLQEPYTATGTLTAVAAKIIETKAALQSALDNVSLLGNAMVATKDTNQAIVDALGTAANLDVTTSRTASTGLLKIDDFSIGSVSTAVLYPKSNIDDHTVPVGSYQATNTSPSTGIRPTGASDFGYIEVVRYDINDIKQTYTNRSDGLTWSRVISNGVVESWSENFDSGNSVNPLDYGIGGIAPTITDANSPVIGSFQSSGAITNATAVAANFPDLGVVGTTSVWWNICTYAGNVSRTTQEATEVFGLTSSNTARKFIRNKHDSTWDVWVEIFTSGNSNKDTFGGSAGGIISRGVARGSTTIYFQLPIDFFDIPSSITVTGNFELRDKSGSTAVVTGVTSTDMNLVRSTIKCANVQVTVASGMTADDTYYLVSTDNSSKIKVNL